MHWKNAVFSSFRLYGVTSLTDEREEACAVIEAAYRGGADIIQLRSKNLPDAALFRLGLKIRKIADSYQKLFFVNDRADIALALDADGVHLGQDDLPVQTVRRLCVQAGKSLWIGKSTHSIAQGRSALLEKPDYLGVGPVFETPTKPDYVPAGLEYVRQASREFKIPFVAIGGIDLKNLESVLASGARKIAAVRALFDAPDAEKAARQFKNTMEGYIYAKS